jgi:hypothetical protein
MDDIIELSDLNMDSGGDSFGSHKKLSFGGGLELLMNDKRDSKLKSDINIDDLNNLEEELNGLVDEPGPSIGHSFSSNLFGSSSSNNNGGSSFDDKPNVRFNESPNVGQQTADGYTDTKTWDGFSKFNNIPVNPDKQFSSGPQMTKEEMLREKFKVLRKLESLEKKGVDLTKKYSMESNLLEMQGEYEMIMEEKAAKNSVKFQANMMMAVINGIEFLNSRFDPFDIKLDGWGDQINENISDYDEVFGELYDKYKSKASMSPELKLLFQLGGSAMMVHMTNTMFKTAMPGMDDIFRQNPDLMRHFQSAAVNSMSDSNPGFSGFMQNIVNPEPSVPMGRGPPAPQATHGPGAAHINSSNRPGNNRPDQSIGKGVFAQQQQQNDGIHIRENYGTQEAERSKRPVRAEMKGPSDISDILSGLKTKTINIQEPAAMQQSSANEDDRRAFDLDLGVELDMSKDNNDSSTISISDLKELQGGINVPKKSKRRQKSDKNTVSLDI